ncbi:MAG: hypothetical protein ACE5F5_01850 [Acidimicrobiia bacterium]
MGLSERGSTTTPWRSFAWSTGRRYRLWASWRLSSRAALVRLGFIAGAVFTTDDAVAAL